MGGNVVSRWAAVGLAVTLATAAIGRTQTMAVGDRSVPVRMALVRVDMTNEPLIRVLDAIAKQAGLRTSWNDAVFNVQSRVTVHVQDVPADVAFAKALVGTGLRAVITTSFVSIVRDVSGVPMAQGGISGKILDANTKAPVRRATVTLDHASNGVTSGDDGTFRFTNVAPGTHTLHVRLLGYQKSAKPVTVEEGQTAAVEIVLVSSVSMLDQIVVTGTVNPTELKAVPSAITVITAKELEERGITKIDQLFRGDVPGLFAVNTGSYKPLDEVVMFSRGATVLTTGNGVLPSNPIKTYVDGVELADPQYLNQIDPRSIERIEILTGPQASTIYGSNAINGVMQIFTKRGTGQRQGTLSLMSGLIENNFTPHRTPMHTHSGSVSGTEGRWSYNTGISWDYTGAWTPAKQTQRTSLYGGGRMQGDRLGVEIVLRGSVTRNRSTGDDQQAFRDRSVQGINSPYAVDVMGGATTVSNLNGQTFGTTLRYTPWHMWSHELVLGTDASTRETAKLAPRYQSSSDTTKSLDQNTNVRKSLRYATTAQIAFGPAVRASLVGGVDYGVTNTSRVNSSFTPQIVGTITNPSVTRGRPVKNTGSFMQAQVGIADALFVTTGLRIEWNRNYGADANPNVAPRYGLVYTSDLGSITLKVRTSYGRSTRPPTETAKQALVSTSSDPAWYPAAYDSRLANPELGPEFQQGGEGGLELYFGSRGSLVITRYNQTVDGLITNPTVDSVRSLQQPATGSCSPQPGGVFSPVDGYCYIRQNQNLNIGAIRNQGWELQSSLRFGAVTARGTYSWTKSRIIGVTPKYRALLPNFVPGAPFRFIPEHTWALGATYANAATTVSLAVTGTGELYRDDGMLELDASAGLRLRAANSPRWIVPSSFVLVNTGYAMADLNASHRFSSRLEGLVQIRNATNFYRNDWRDVYASIGRQSQLGLRLTW